MKTRLVLVTLATVGSFSCTTPLYAENENPSDYDLVVEATQQSELDYDQLRTRLFQRYTPVIEQMEQSATGYTSIFAGGSGKRPTIGAGSIPEGFKPWWQARVNSQINPAAETSQPT